MSLLHWLSFLLSSEHTSTFPGNPPAPYSQYRCPQRFLPDLICQDVCYQCKQKGGGLWCNPTATLNPPVSLSLYMSCTNHSWQPQFLSCELWTCMLSIYPQMHIATLSDHRYFFSKHISASGIFHCPRLINSMELMLSPPKKYFQVTILFFVFFFISTWMLLTCIEIFFLPEWWQIFHIATLLHIVVEWSNIHTFI